MEVKHKLTGKIYGVFDVRCETSSGYPQFLIFKDGQWRYIGAKYFIPHVEVK